MRLFLCFIFASVMTVQAEIQRWPMRIIETTYTVNSLTGAKYNYKDKNKVSTVVVDVNLVNDNGEKVIRFKQRATSSMVETKSETAEGDVVVQDLPKMLDAVEKSVSEMSRISKQEDLEEVLFEGSSVKLTLCRHKRKMFLLVELERNTGFFELDAARTRQFRDLLKRWGASVNGEKQKAN
jgi:hypothetical protein